MFMLKLVFHTFIVTPQARSLDRPRRSTENCASDQRTAASVHICSNDRHGNVGCDDPYQYRAHCAKQRKYSEHAHAWCKHNYANPLILIHIIYHQCCSRLNRNRRVHGEDLYQHKRIKHNTQLAYHKTFLFTFFL